MNDDLFLVIVSFFAGWGWQSLGKVVNPVSGKEEKNLPMAKQSIELLRTLQEKTKNNLTDREQQALEATIADLQLNYVDEFAKQPAQPPGEPEPDAPKAP